MTTDPARTDPAPDASDAPAATGLSHVRPDGSAHMVDVSAKPSTVREAEARGLVRTRPDVLARILAGDLPKGEAIPLARVAGILGAKRTSDLVPLCHPLPLSGVEVDVRAAADEPAALEVVARVRTTGPTGVEMEALTAVSVTALTVYDMIKAVDREAVIADVRVVAKSGGRSGDWRRGDAGEQGTDA